MEWGAGATPLSAEFWLNKGNLGTSDCQCDVIEEENIFFKTFLIMIYMYYIMIYMYYIPCFV